MKTVVVIPTYNERDNVAKLIPAIAALELDGWEIIIVDDNSPDGTGKIVTDWQSVYPEHIHLVKRQRKLGLGTAYVAGFKKALAIGAELIVEMDADWSHRPADIPRLINACNAGADLAIGSRRIKDGKVVGWNAWRHIISFGATSFARLILRLKTHDVTAGFRVFRRRALESLNLDDLKSGGYAFQEEVLYRLEKNGFKVTEVPVIFTDRADGKSKLSKKDIWEFFKVIFFLKLYGTKRN